MNLNFSNTQIGKLRMAGLAEGISFLVLLLIAMPLKYIAHLPQAVKVIGWIHGLLFILYILALIRVWLAFKWSFKRLFIAFIAALLPFGTFILDAQLRKEEQTLN
ncbi:MAG: DUF3817 domain-containing protein [Bacteroidia bacterium]|nr:DUF3817 domain-containing protein [Bacteroidia bacterium]